MTTLAELRDEGQRAWPGLKPDPPIAEIVQRKATGLSALDPAEVFIAAALLAGDPAAPAAFEQRYFDVIRVALERARASPEDIDEVRQILRTRLLMPDDDGVPRVIAYCGGGRLTGLLRVSALRALINLRAKRRVIDDPEDTLATLVAADLDPHRARVKEEERSAVTEAIRAAARSLSGRSRTLLRLNLVDGLSIDELGRVFGIHRATAARQLARAREELITGVRERLAQLWGSDADALTLVSSQLEITLGRILATTGADPP